MSKQNVSPLLIQRPAQLNNAEFVLTGYGLRTVRMRHKGKEIGFATTTYSHHLTDEMKEYAAERIMLLMTFAQGFTNEQIIELIAARQKP